MKYPRSNSAKAKMCKWVVNKYYPGMEQILGIEEPKTLEEPVEIVDEPAEVVEEPVEEPAEVVVKPVEEPKTMVAPVEATVDGQTITINVTINLRR